MKFGSTRVVPDCRVNSYLLSKSTTSRKGELSKETLVRRFTEHVKAPLIKCDVECRRHLDMTIGGQPRSGSQWIDALNDMGLGLGSRRKELDKCRWIVKKYNDQKEVKSGAVAAKKFIAVLPTDWSPRVLAGSVRDFQDPVIPLIAQFCPRLCTGLGFRPAPSCFSGRKPKVSPSVVFKTPSNSSRRQYHKRKRTGHRSNVSTRSGSTI